MIVMTAVCRRCLLYARLKTFQRSVSTLSPLTSAFNAKPSKKIKFRFKEEASAGLFCIPELTDHTGFAVLEDHVSKEVDTLVAEACSANRHRKMVVIFDELSDSICKLADMADFVRVSHPDPQYKTAAEQTCLKMASIVEKLNTNVDIHRELNKVIKNGDVVEVNDVDQRVAELFNFDFEQSGIHLDDETRAKFVSINNYLMRLSNNFMHGCHQPTPWMNYGLHPELQNCFHVEGDRPFLNTLHSEHGSETIREAAYKIFLYPVSNQADLLQDLLEGRRLLADIVGFESFAQRTLKGTLADTPENVMEFLVNLSSNLKAGAQKDYQIMKKEKARMKKTESRLVRNDDVMAWDPAYFSAAGRYQMYDDEKLSEYFSLGSCMDGLSHLFQCLYDVSLENVHPEPGEMWNYDVYKLAVVHKTEGTLGYIYCDFYERPGKPNQDCHFTIQGGRQLDSGEYQLPKVVLQLNFPFPGTFTPSLLIPGHVENLFHEFGHAMHSMLGRTKYQHVTGTRCPIDFAEVPSVLMEYFASDPRVLKSFAKHYKTGEPLDTTILRNFTLSKRMFIYSEMELQVFYAILDQIYHGAKSLENTSTTDILKETQNQHYGIPYVEKTAWQLRFGHLVGYGGKYYSYLMSRAIASRIWRQCFKDNPFNRKNGERYRRELLAHGGERHPRELVQALIGEEPTIDMMIDSLTEDVRSRAVFIET